MSVQVLQIQHKVRDNPIWPVSLADFETSPAGSVAPSILVDEPTITPYSLDHANRQAIFVETPPDLDLSQAPFYYQWQYEHALRLFVAPYDLLYELTDAIDNRGENLIFIHSTGRCGSTLFSRTLNQSPAVVSLSEPDVYTLLVGLRNLDGAYDPELGRLIRAFTLLLCKPAPTKSRPLCWAIKFRSMAIEIGHLLYDQFPQAKTVFMYRNAESWARSSASAFRLLDPQMAATVAAYHQVFLQWMPLMQTYAPAADTVAPVSRFLAPMWLSLMQRYLELHERGIPMCALRYEDLQAAPEEMLAVVFAYCGLLPPDLDDMIAVLSQDSQRGTSLSQEAARHNPYDLTDQHLLEIRSLLQTHPVLNTTDVILPNTLSRHQRL
jgi:hypothetical protein